jgi:GAF domain-containing protein
VTLYQYDQSTKRFLVEGTGPTIAGELREPGPMKTRIYPDDVPWKIVESGESRFLSDAQHDPFLLGVVRHPGEPERPRFVVREGIVSSAALLLQVGTEIVGVMFANYRTPHYFSAEEKRILETFANYAAVAINNARLFRKTRARAEELERLRRVSQAIRGSIDLPEVLQLIVDSVGRALQADIAVLYPHDPVSREFVLEQVVYCGDESSKLVPREPRSHGIVQKTMEKDILIVEDVEDFYISSSAQPSENEFVRRVGIKSFVGASLRAGEEIVGVLFADFQQAHMFTDTEINTIRAFADQAAIAIQNTRLYERTSEVLQLKIQELQSTQDELLDAERWETLGKAAFSLAHRINNTTGLVPVAIQDAAELLAGVPMDAERRRDLEADLDRIERNTRFTLDLAGMLLKPFIAPPSEECSVNVLVKEAISVANIPDGVDLVTLLSERLPTITTSRLLVDVFVELITNAIQAMPKGGRLEIGSHLRKDDWIEVWLSDTGHGIAPEDQRRVFDLFFTTSEERLGFGLWWVNTFLIQQGATITLESVVGRGSTFTVRLPVDSGTETQ